MKTYTYEVSFKKNGQKDYCTVRAFDKVDAIRKACESLGDITPISVTQIGN